MILYLTIYAAVLFWFYNTFGGNNTRNNIALFTLLMGLALFVGFADMLGGYDRYAYCDLFDGCADCLRDGRNVFDIEENPVMGYKREMSYVIWNIIVAHITENRYIFILITAIATFLAIFEHFRRHAQNYPLAVLIFLSLWFFFTFTYIRQVLAVCVTGLAYKYVIDRKFIPFFICAFIAYKFHNSAIVFFILYFLPLKKYPEKTILIVMSVLLVLGVTGIGNGLYLMYGETNENGDRVEQNLQYSSTRLDYIIEAVFFLVVILKNYHRIPEDKVHLVFLNASLMFCAILLVFVQSPSGGRQSWYYIFGIIFTLSSFCLDRKSIDDFVKGVLALMFFLYFRILYSWGYLIIPYKSFLTNGHRPEDVTLRARYEYDDNYDENKFYRKPIDFVWYGKKQ